MILLLMASLNDVPNLRAIFSLQIGFFTPIFRDFTQKQFSKRFYREYK